MTATDLPPEDVLMHLVVTLLAPSFLATPGVDPVLARAAAAHTVSAHTASAHTVSAHTGRHPIDLILNAQAAALGLAVLSSVSLSMADDLPISLILRLRGNAASLNRAADTCRRAMAGAQPEAAACPPPRRAFNPAAEAAIVTEVARSQAKAAAWQASLASQPVPGPSPRPEPERPASPPTIQAPMAAVDAGSKPRVAPDAATVKSTGAIPPADAIRSSNVADERRRSAWCSAMADVAAEMSTELVTLPPAERRAAGIRLAALSSTANTLISGVDPYPSR